MRRFTRTGRGWVVKERNNKKLVSLTRYDNNDERWTKQGMNEGIVKRSLSVSLSDQKTTKRLEDRESKMRNRVSVLSLQLCTQNFPRRTEVFLSSSEEMIQGIVSLRREEIRVENLREAGGFSSKRMLTITEASDWSEENSEAKISTFPILKTEISNRFAICLATSVWINDVLSSRMKFWAVVNQGRTGS